MTKKIGKKFNLAFADKEKYSTFAPHYLGLTHGVMVAL